MLSDADNELICRVGSETPMGQSMRRFWLPALMSSELPATDRDPVHVELLNESFVAFRDANGQVGLLDEFCCHRGASLTIGRVEDCGIRCIYHGWLFAPDGTVLETPNVQDPGFKSRIKGKAYPVREAGGLIWTYLGPKEKEPPFPDFPWIDADPSMRSVATQINGCNYVQMLEGLYDSSHLSVLHSSTIKLAATSDLDFAKSTSHMVFDVAPRIEVEETAFGLHSVALRNIDGMVEVRVTGFVAPFWHLNPNGNITVAVVPLSDVKSAYYVISWDGRQAYGEEPLASEHLKLIGFNRESLEAFGQTRQTFGQPQSLRRENGFRQDRTLMRQGHFTGMPTLALEDSVVSTSCGPLRSRVNERLAPSDKSVAAIYKLLLKAARRAANNEDPIGLGVSVNALRGTPGTLDSTVDWRTLVPQHYEAPLRKPIIAAF